MNIFGHSFVYIYEYIRLFVCVKCFIRIFSDIHWYRNFHECHTLLMRSYISHCIYLYFSSCSPHSMTFVVFFSNNFVLNFHPAIVHIPFHLFFKGCYELVKDGLSTVEVSIVEDLVKCTMTVIFGQINAFCR